MDLAFFRDTLVMAVSNQSVFLMNMTASTFAEVPNTHGVLSVSVDWLTQRLFWANPHRQMVGPGDVCLACYSMSVGMF